MIITPLGHTEFLVDIANDTGENVRILVDSWLSDFAIGDLMERTVKVIIDPEKIATIDAIYISHTHSDHFDPYSLVGIYNSCHIDEGDSSPGKTGQDFSSSINEADGLCRNDKEKFPLLILPFTLRYLEPILTEYLPSARIHWLGNQEKYLLKGIEITGYMWPNPEITNEDDVMMIAISSDRELVFAEIDTVPDAFDEEVQQSLYDVFARREYETTCYLASRNCLEGQIPYYDVPEKKRKPYRDKYIADQKESIREQYEKYEYEEFVHFPNLFTLPGFVRGFIGQGIAYPYLLSEELYSLSLFPLDELVSIESDYAKNAGYSFPQKALIPGRQYRVENGTIEQGRKDCLIGELVKSDERRVKNNDSIISNGAANLSSRQSSSVPVMNDERSGSGKDLSTSFVPRSGRDDNAERLFATGPLFPRELGISEIDQGKVKILEILNHRFLPYWSVSPVAILRDALIQNNGVYRVVFQASVISSESRVLGRSREILPRPTEQDFSYHSKGQKSTESIIFEYSTARSGFIEVPYDATLKIDEDYWLLDVLDFLEGRQELYSSFWHTLDPRRIYRLWTCLGANYMNNDLVLKKYRLHFERAIRRETVGEWVKSVIERF